MAKLRESRFEGGGRDSTHEMFGRYVSTRARAAPPALADVAEMVFHGRLRPPSLPPDLVTRPRLLRALDLGMTRPVSLLSAPAGYGKTTLASQWVDVRDHRVAWVSLEEQDDELAPFIMYLASAVAQAAPKSMRRTLGFLRQGFLPGIGALGLALLNDLSELSGRCVLVLDGVERLRDPPVLELLSALLRHPPDPLHLMLIGRRDPFVPIASLRGATRISEIRAKDLRFTPEETVTLLEKSRGGGARVETAKAWTDATEGWVTGLKLALSEAHGEASDETVTGALTSHVREYLVSEILDREPDSVRRFLLDISLLDRLCPELCAAVGGEVAGDASDESLRRIQDQGLFLIPLDSADEWFRFHGLVKRFLEMERARESDPTRDVEIHRRASRWFADNGYLEEAVRHALRAGDSSAAAALIEERSEELMDTDQWEALRRSLSLVPADLLDDRSQAQLVRAWLAVRDGRHQEAALAAARAETLSEQGGASAGCAAEVRGVVRAILSSISRDRVGESVEFARHALMALPAERSFCRGVAMANLHAGLWMAGERVEAEAVTEPLLESPEDHPIQSRDRLLGLMCALRWVSGDVESLEQMADRCAGLARERTDRRPMALAQLYRGLLCYEHNDLPEAEEHLEFALDAVDVLSESEAMDLRYGLARVFRAQGRHQAAHGMADACDQAVSAQLPPQLLWHHGALKAELALMYGRADEALELLEPWERFDLSWAPTRLHPGLMLVRALVAAGDAAGLVRAQTILRELEGPAMTGMGDRFAVERHGLEALVLSAVGERQAAHETVAESLTAAEPGGFVRWYVDAGPAMAELLKPLARRHPNDSFVRTVLTAYYEDLLASGSGGESDHEEPIASESGPVDQLTPKESSTLQLLAKGLYNKEIAERSFVSVETVKTHLKHIYRKLNVSNRRQAVTRARALGLLPHD